MTLMATRLQTYLSFVRFSHSVFALPFAFAGALLASRQSPITWPVVVSTRGQQTARFPVAR
jgi:4-hydroxybenzoate polyprenyltransferase